MKAIGGIQRTVAEQVSIMLPGLCKAKFTGV